MSEKGDQNLSRFRILFIKPDQGLLKTLGDMGLTLLTTPSVEEARQIIKAEKLDLIVAGGQLDSKDRADLCDWVERVFNPSNRMIPNLDIFIVYAEGENLDESLKGHNFHTSISLEISSDDLKAQIFKYFELEDESKEQELEPRSEQLEQTYCKISIYDILMFKTLELDFFLKLSETKYLMVGHSGDQLNEEQIERYNKKGVKFLYVRAEDYKKVVDLNLKMNRTIRNHGGITELKKKQFMLRTGEIILEETFVSGINQTTFNTASDYLLSSLETILENNDSFELLEMLNDHSDHLYAHSLGVSIYSIMVAQRMGWRSGKNLFNLSLGAILHDIGKNKIPPEILAKPVADLSPPELEFYKKHPEFGREMVEGQKQIPSDVVAIIYEHHENGGEDGFPRGLEKSRISPMARIVAVADEFCYYAIRNPNFPNTNAATALKALETYKESISENEAFHALKRVIEKPKKAG